jgi:hypothetical protein
MMNQKGGIFMSLQIVLTVLGLSTIGPVSTWANMVVFDTFGPGNAYVCCAGVGDIVGNQFSPSATGNLVQFDVAIGHSSGSNQVQLSLYADTSNHPGALIESYTITAATQFGTCCSIEVVPSVIRPLLIADNAYWLIASSAINSGNVWNDNSIGAVGNVYFNGMVFLDNGNSAFGVYESTTVPESGSAVLIAVGLVCFAMVTLRLSRARLEAGI